MPVPTTIVILALAPWVVQQLKIPFVAVPYKEPTSFCCRLQNDNGFFPGATFKEQRQVQPFQLLLMWQCENAGGTTRNWLD
jgi:hypothetical protein